MLASGTGIAPMVQIIQTIVENEDDNTFVHLVYSCRSQHDILLKDKLDRLASYWNFTVVYVLSQSSESSIQEDCGAVRHRPSGTGGWRLGGPRFVPLYNT